MVGPEFVIGNIAKGKDLWDRHEEIKNIWKALERGSVLLKAPRRFGKSSIMYNLYENPRNDFKVFFQDTEGMNEPQDFISALITKILMDSHIRNKLKSMAKWLMIFFTGSGEFDRCRSYHKFAGSLVVLSVLNIYWKK